MNSSDLILLNDGNNAIGPRTAFAAGTLKKYALASDGKGIGVLGYNGTITWHDGINNVMTATIMPRAVKTQVR